MRLLVVGYTDFARHHQAGGGAGSDLDIDIFTTRLLMVDYADFGIKELVGGGSRPVVAATDVDAGVGIFSFTGSRL